MSTARDTILAHRERIATGQLTWVGHKPEKPGECCLGYTVDVDGPLLPISAGVDRFEVIVLSALDAEAMARGELSFATWNDHVCRTPQQATEFLAAAAERCDE